MGGLLGVRTLSSAEGLGMIIKTTLGLKLRMSSLAAMLIYVGSRVPVCVSGGLKYVFVEVS